MAGFDIASMLSGKAAAPSGRQKAGRALSAISAGLMGQGPQYLQMLGQQDQQANQEAKQLSAERLKAMAVDAQRVNALLISGDIQGALRVVDNRTSAIRQLGGDASDTLRIRQLITAGEVPAAQAELGQFLQAAQGYGLIEGPQMIPQSNISPQGQIAMMGPNGQPSVQNIPGFKTEPQDQYQMLSVLDANILGLPSDRRFKRNLTNGDIQQVGSGPAVQVNTGDQSAGMKAADTAFATQTYLPWVTGGGADTIGQIATLMPVLEKLEKNEPITGPLIAALPEWYKTLTPAGVESIDARNLVQQVVQRNLREILGAQFTAVEGENLIKQAYNEALPPEKNLPRVRRLIEAIQQGAEQKNAMVDYFQKNGSIAGFRGKLPTLQDFYEAVGENDAGAVDDPLGLLTP